MDDCGIINQVKDSQLFENCRIMLAGSQLNSSYKKMEMKTDLKKMG